MSNTKIFLTATIVCVLMPLFGLLAIEYFGGGIFNGLAASSPKPSTIEPTVLEALFSITALLLFGGSTYLLARQLSILSSIGKKLSAIAIWLMAGVSTILIWIVWSWSW